MISKNKNYILFILFLLISWYPASCMDTIEKMNISNLISEEHLNNLAINQHYGYKAANLIILKDLCAKINIKKTSSYTIAVPLFEVISSNKIQVFFATYLKISIEDKWNAIIKEYFPTEEIKTTTLSSQQFPNNFLSACNKFEEELKSSLKNLNPEVLQNFSFDTYFQTQGIDKCIEHIQRNNEKIMVRSSGKEDTKSLANAGGNMTVANVIPTANNILHALLSVVASYFSQTSLIQRLGAQDASLFDVATPLTPIIIQRMIDTAGEIPTRCGVMFTEETEGGIAKYNTKESTGITIIQAAYGHNEGVVNSRVIVDTYYVTNNQNIFSIIRPKIYRMSPTKQTGILSLEKNSTEIINTSSLTKEMTLLLKLVANELEKAYGDPMDIEFVINDNEKTIYIVQARPLVYNHTTIQPSYIINPSHFENNKKLIGSSIGIAGGSLHHCTNENEIIITETINQALSLYQQLKGPEKKKIKCIIIGNIAPITSHEATSFRSESKPVLYMKNWQTIKEWLKEPSPNIVISPQQGLIINTYTQNITIKQLINDNIAALGWIAYPMEHYISLIETFDPHLQLDGISIAQIMPKINEIELRKKFENVSRPWKEILHTIKIENELDARVTLAQLLYEINSIIERQSIGIKLDEDLLNKIRSLKSFIIYCALNIASTLHLTPQNLHYPQRLFAIGILESLLYQQPLFNEIIKGYSVTTIIAKELTEEKNIIQQKQQHKSKQSSIPLNPLSIQLMRIKQFALSSNLETEWNNFIIQLNQPENATFQKTFAGFIKELATLNVLPLWLNTSFAQKIAENKFNNNLEIIIDNIFKEYTTQKNFLTIIKEKKEKIASFNIQTFADPQLFSSQWETFQKELLHYFISEEFLTTFKDANAFGQLIAINLMSQFIETFDNAIKTVTGRIRPTNNENEITDFDKEKITHFHTMLTQYTLLFEEWIPLIPENTLGLQPIIKSRIILIRRSLALKINPLEALKISPGFNVGLFAIGSGVGRIQDTDRPKTYEDVFTGIHQCLLAIINAISRKNNLIENIALPTPLNELSQMILNITFNDSVTSLIGVAVKPPHIELKYNLTLRTHSMYIIAKQNKNDSQAYLTVTLYGDNENSRWNKIEALTKIISKALTPVTTINTTQKSCSITFLINQETPLKDLQTFITTLADYSTGSYYKTNPLALKSYASLISNNIELIKDTELQDAIHQEIQPLLKSEPILEPEIPYSQEQIPTNQSSISQQSLSIPPEESSINHTATQNPTFFSALINNIKIATNTIVTIVKQGLGWIRNLVSNFFKR